MSALGGGYMFSCYNFYVCAWCCQLGELCDAEDALTEANVLNNLEPEVWAYLCLLCLDTERHVEAEQAYKYTLKV